MSKLYQKISKQAWEPSIILHIWNPGIWENIFAVFQAIWSDYFYIVGVSRLNIAAWSRFIFTHVYMYIIKIVVNVYSHVAIQ